LSQSKRNFLFTSESVTEGHPDKIADQISDAVLDEVMRQDPKGRVACETLVTTGLVVVAGEITTSAHVNYDEIARETVRQVGYDNAKYGFDSDTCAVVCTVKRQSADIAMGVDTEVRKNGKASFLRPDGKSQVTVEYRDGKPARVDCVVISTQHSEDVANDTLRSAVVEQVIKPIVPAHMLDSKTIFHINPTGRFVIGGPMGDAGLTGRKIIVDSYGGYSRHGGGAFSGKDPSKVDRSACYMARYIAKNIVAAGLATRAEVQLAYAIGVAEPVSVMVDSFGTSTIPEERITQFVRESFALTPKGIIETLDLRKPIYKPTAAYGHFGRTGPGFTWERTDRADALRKAAGLGIVAEVAARR